MSRRPVLVPVLLASVLGVVPVRAQQPPAPPADTVTLSPEALLRARQIEALERLSRPPGQDTLQPPPEDSVPGEPRPLVTGVRPGAPPGVGLDATGDTVMDRLLSDLRGYDPVQYEAASASFQASTRDLYLYGDSARGVSVRYESNRMVADTSIHYNPREELVTARGRPVMTPSEGEAVASRELLVDTRTREASALGAETRYTEGAEWLVTGDLPRIGRDLVYATHARFTSCTLEVPHYHFGAGQIKIIRGSLLVAAPVKLYFADVPVMWLPFVAQSLATGRASGLLTPRFSVNDVVRSSGGYQRRISNVGFYWAMSDYTDATVALDWFSGNFTALTSSLRYRWAPKFLSGTISARRFWRDRGGTEFSLNGQHAWQMSERASMTASLAFVSSTSFLRQNTFDPLEATQQITSSGGLTRRFDWGTLNLLANRSQSLSDDRVDMTLPRATLSLKTITLLPAPASNAGWFNNITWSGGANLSRRMLDLAPPAEDDPFQFSRLDQRQSSGSVNHSLGIGNLGISQDLRVQEAAFLGVPRDTLSFFPDPATGGLVDIRQATLDWSSSLSYQQQLVGATSITPNVTISSSALRSDTMEVAQGFVSSPARVSFGASVNSHLYGFFPGFGAFEAMRHRISPGLSYQWAPEVEPTALQRQVFGPTTLQPQSRLSLSLSQTFEAKRRAPETDSLVGVIPAPAALPDSVAPADPDPAGAAPDAEEGPTRPQQGEIVTLLALHTSSLTYDFVEADSAGHFLQGFQTTRLRNEIDSDYLRGLTLSVEHDLFHDSLVSGTGEEIVRERSFAPHLSAVNLRFTLNASSSVFRWLGLGSPDSVGVGDEASLADQSFDPDDPFAERRGVTDDASILPGRDPGRAAETQEVIGRRSDWNLGVSYALTRPRGGSALRESSENLRLSASMQPTELWRMSWRTSYDLESGQFSDHMVTLTRDLHRWQAHFDFMKTATGNWAFRFEVALLDNHDLRFDFDQRSVEGDGRLLPPP